MTDPKDARKFSLYPPAVAGAMLGAGIGLVSVPCALIVVGGLALAAWAVYFVDAIRRAR